MTNFQGPEPSALRREQVLVAGPALIGGLMALAVAALGLLPSGRAFRLISGAGRSFKLARSGCLRCAVSSPAWSNAGNGLKPITEPSLS